MKLIEIREWKDFRKLENLKGKDYIYVKVYITATKGIIDAVDLQHFSGTIDLSFAYPQKYYKVSVRTNDIKKVQGLFKNVGRARIVMSQNVFLNLAYVYQEKHVDVKTEKDILQAILKHPLENLVLDLKNDLVIQRDIDIPSTFTFQTNKFMIFAPRKENFCSRMNPLIYYDHLVKVQDVQDLKTLKQISTGTTVVLFQNDLTNFVMPSLNLAHFQGDLYLLGNGFRLSNGVVLQKDESLGFISELHPYANLLVKDFTLENISFKGNKPNYCGGILGTRTSKGMQSPEGQILFQNCIVKNCVFPKAYMENHVFLGNEMLESQMKNCSFVNVYADKKVLRQTKVEWDYPLSLKRK